eukprot:11266677-Karenia_brevis.AAC.1
MVYCITFSAALRALIGDIMAIFLHVPGQHILARGRLNQAAPAVRVPLATPGKCAGCLEIEATHAQSVELFIADP